MESYNEKKKWLNEYRLLLQEIEENEKKGLFYNNSKSDEFAKTYLNEVKALNKARNESIFGMKKRIFLFQVRRSFFL